MNHRYVRGLALVGCIGAALCWSGPAHGQALDGLFDLMLRKGMIDDKELKELKETVDTDMARAMARQTQHKSPMWIESMKWGMDLRLRTEYFDNEDQSSTIDRWRFRYRLRLGVTAKFTDWATAGVRLASGDATDPVSTNETMDDSFQKDPIQIDTAFVTITPPGADWIAVTGGKMDNQIWQPAFGSPMIYDFDLTPEGAAEQLNWKFGGEEKRHKLFANFGQYLINEISGSADNDGFMFDFQGGAEFNFGKDPKKPTVKAKVAGGYYFTCNVDNGALTGDSPNLGNAINVTGTTTNFLADFEVVSVRGEVAWQLSQNPFCGTPAVFTFAGEYDKNLADEYDDLTGASSQVDPDQTEGYAGQIAFGSNKKKGEWQVAYQYKYLEADATLDGNTDSDWGLGGTDRQGHLVKASYNLQEWWQLAFGAFITEKISDRPNSGNNVRGDADEELLRIQIDNIVKF